MLQQPQPSATSAPSKLQLCCNTCSILLHIPSNTAHACCRPKALHFILDACCTCACCTCLQHPPVYTLGAGSSEEHVKFDLQQPPHRLYRTERGGEVTYHGPGQVWVQQQQQKQQQFQVDDSSSGRVRCVCSCSRKLGCMPAEEVTAAAPCRW
jgi:hypothetical protein